MMLKRGSTKLKNHSTVAMVVLLLAAQVETLWAFAPAIPIDSTRRPMLAGTRATYNRLYETAFGTSFMWNAGLNYGKGKFKFYDGFDNWMSVFPDEDKQAYPELFNLPKGLSEVRIAKPLGIVFEEIETGNKGVQVQDLVEDGHAASLGTVQIGDVLAAITAVKIVGAKYERRLIPARNFDFDTMVGAVASNERKWGCNDVILLLERPGEADRAQVDQFLEFFEPPFDNPWKQRQ